MSVCLSQSRRGSLRLAAPWGPAGHKPLYDGNLRVLLELEHNNEFVAIKPDSQDYVVARSSGNAMWAMLSRHPKRRMVLMKIGPEPEYGLAARILAGRDGRSIISDASFRPILLADGSRRERPVYQFVVEWQGEDRVAEVVALEGNPLLGVELMEGSLIQAEMKDGAEVALAPM